MSTETILITGGAGNLARQLTDDLLGEGHRIPCYFTFAALLRSCMCRVF